MKMIHNGSLYLISRRLHPVPFFKMLANLEGLNLPTAEEKRTFQPLRVEDALLSASQHPEARPNVSLFPDEPLDAAMRLLAVQPSIQVVSRLKPDKVLGVLMLEDVHRAYGIQVTTEPKTQAATAEAISL